MFKFSSFSQGLVNNVTEKKTEGMRGLKVRDILNSSETTGTRNKATGGVTRIRSLISKPKSNNNNSTSAVANLLVPLHLPYADTIEPSIEPYLKPINLVEALAELYHRLECCPQSQKALLCVEQYSLLRSLGDQKFLRRCLRTARQNAEDVLSKVVLSAWLRFERREDELVGVSSMDCGDRKSVV